MRVLWLASWYPSKVNFLDGDFIERHATAASLDNEILVIHVVKTGAPGQRGIIKEEKIYSDRLTAWIYYYPSYKQIGNWYDKLASSYWYLRLHFKAFHTYRWLYGKPAGILVQAGLKAGIPAVWFKKFYGIRYLLFERWAGLLPEAIPNFSELSLSKRWWWKRAIRHSSKLLTVSEYFARMIYQYHYKTDWMVIPNTVSPSFRYESRHRDSTLFQFIHVSNMDYQKNFEDQLRATAILVQKSTAFHLTVYGPIQEKISQLVKELGLQQYVSFRGEVSHAEIATAMQDSDALLLYSRYETFGNVVTEANACGLPVIVSDHPVFKEIMEEGVTGISVPGEKPALLAACMEWMMNNPSHFDRQKISDMVHEKYAPRHISQLFDQVFQETFNPRR